MSTDKNSTVAFEVPVEAPVLQPNDALILMLIARYEPPAGQQREKLLALLSDEGKRIAQSLLRLTADAEQPESVLATVRGLREWVKHETRSQAMSKVRHKKPVSLTASSAREEDARPAPVLHEAACV